MMRTAPLLLAPLLLLPLPAAAQERLLTRVIDTGPGHASVTVVPGGFYMVYDTGHWNHDREVSRCILSLIPEDEAIDLLVLSHSDADHVAATDELFAARRVRTVLRTGLKRKREAWREADLAIRRAAQAGHTAVFNLRHNQLAPGTGFLLGSAAVTFLAGDDCPDYDLRGSGDCARRPKARNAGSIVLRLDYAGRSILFTGDAVGRKDGAPDDAKPIATEAELLSRKDEFTIDSDVIVAPHHGADNASSLEFINAVSPEWVIFPAGSRHKHPRQTTVERYLSQGVKLERILRTDLGDNEGPREWGHGGTADGDKVGDDDIDIVICADGTLTVRYREDPAAHCKEPNVAFDDAC